MSLSISFASLVKNNNGMFKSQKQADFLLSMSNDSVYSTSGNVFRNSFYMDYFCDEQGAIKVTKRTDKKATVTTWERKSQGMIPVQDLKEIKSLKRMMKQTQQALIDTADYVWADPEMGKEVEASRKMNIEFWTNRILELE